MRLLETSSLLWNSIQVLNYVTKLLFVVGFRSTVETHKQLMVVQLFSAETDFHMSKNMRFGGKI